MENQVELYSKINNPIEAIKIIGDLFAKSGMFGCKSVEQGQVLAMTCLSEKKTPVEIMKTYHLIDGKLAMRADAMLAGLRQNGGKHKVLSRTADKAEIEITVDGNTQKFSLSWEEAKHEPFVNTKDGKIKTNWATPRARMQMLWARVVSDGVRAMMPEVVAGTYTPEEIGDSEPPRGSPKTVDVTALVETKPPASLATTAIDTPANSETQEAETQETPPNSIPDFSTMPIGNFKGRKFNDFTVKQLKTILEKAPKMEGFYEGHKTAVELCLKLKQEEEAEKNAK